MSTLVGTGKLVRLVLRRDRWLLALWIPFFCLVLLSYARTLGDIFPTAAERLQYADNAGFVALYGPLSGTSLGEFVTWRAGFLPVLVGLVGLLTVIRHTRTDEEAGRRELLGSGVVGRHAPLAAALAATLGASIVLAAAVALAMTGQHLPAAGSLALGAELAAACFMFAAVGALAAQLTQSAAAARGIAVGVLGVTWLLRVAGDLSQHTGGPLGWLSWLSPVAWAQGIRPYGGDRWWLLAPAAGLAAALVVAAVALSSRRDVGAGLVPARPGRAAAPAGLRSPLALAWRLHRGLLAGWTAGFAVLGVVLGGLADGVGDMQRGNQTLQDIFARIGGRAALVDAYLAAILSILGVVAAAYATQAALRPRTEEASGRAESVLATAVGRLRWAASHLAFAVLGPAAALAAAGLAAGLAHGLASGDLARELPRVLGAAMVQLPAVWVLAAVAVALFGLLPRLAVASWGALAVCVLVALVGASARLDQWVLDVSPFTHIPKAPGAAISATPLVWLAAAAVVLAAAGLVGLRRRDLPA